MIIFPAIDLFDGKAVRLLKGDYNQMTVYSDHPEDIGRDFMECGADHIHMVDLEAAKSGILTNLKSVEKVARATDAFIELGGGIRNMNAVRSVFDAGVSRVIIGTAAVENREFLEELCQQYPDKVAVGVDIRDNMVSVNGWTSDSKLEAFDFCKELQKLGIKTIISTDISKDGAMKGPSFELYERLMSNLSMNIIASGGVSSIDDVTRLRSMNLHGAIIGKAYYTKAVDLRQAVREAQ